MNNEFDWANVFGSEQPGGQTAAVGVDSPAEPHNAQSDGQHMHVDAPAPAERMHVVIPVLDEHMHVDAPAPAERMHVADGVAAERTKFKRTTIYLDPVSLAYLGAVDEMPAAWHVRRAVAMYVEGMVKPTVAHQHPAPDPISVSLTPGAHALAVEVAVRMGADVGQLVSAAVFEQLEAMR